MTLLSMTLAVIGLFAQEAPEAPEAGASPESEVIRVLVLHATSEGREAVSLDPTLAPMRAWLSELPYDTFREAGFHEVEAPYGVDTGVAIDGRYTLYCLPREMTESGEVAFDAHIDVKDGDTVLEALRVSGQAARGHGITFRGLDRPGGELIVVLSVAKAAEGGGGAGRGQRASQEGSSGSGSDGTAGGGGAGGGDGAPPDSDTPDFALAGEERDEPESDTGGADSIPAESDDDMPELPPDLANVEGILRALEETDMREQENARSRRYEVIIRGDWW